MWAIALSIALHLPLLFSLPGLFDNRDAMEPSEFDADREFSLSVVEEEDKEEEEERIRRFVSQAKPETPEEAQRPEEADFRDQFDSSTDKEMARRTLGRNGQSGSSQLNPRPSTEQGTNSRPNPRPQPVHRPNEEREPQPPKPNNENPNAVESPEEMTSELDAEADEAAESSEQAVDLEEVEKAEEGVVEKSAKSQPDPSKFFPSMESAQAAMGGGSVDYLRDVDEGEKTLLNRKQSRYWSFMHRFKEGIVQEWSPGEEYRRRDPHGKVYGVKDRATELHVTLNGDGSLRTIFIAKPSGLDFYDDEAVQAVRSAAPFPNPPEGLKDKDGLIHIRFSFFLDLYTNSMRNIRIRRN